MPDTHVGEPRPSAVPWRGRADGDESAPGRRHSIRAVAVRLAGWRVEQRPRPRHLAAYRVGAIVVGVVAAVVLAPLLANVPTDQLYRLAWNGTLGTPVGFANVLAAAIPLVIAGLAAAIPLRLGLWNLGIDGQMIIGAWAAGALAFGFSSTSGAVLIPLAFVAGMAGGALWMLVPALARVYLGVSEIITSFLLNFAAVAWMVYWTTERWVDPNTAGGGVLSRPIPDQAQLGLIDLGVARIHWGVVIPIVLVALTWFILRSTRSGYELRMMGGSEKAGRYGGMSVSSTTVGALLTSGALAGLAGTVVMLGSLHLFGAGLTNSTGFTAIVVAVLAGGSAPAILIIAFVYAVLIVGGDSISVAGVAPETVFSLVGLTLLLAALGEGSARLRFVRIRPTKVGARAAGPAAEETPA